MEWNKDNIDEIVEFINRELKTGRPMNNIELEEFGVNERVIHKRLLRIGYKKIDNQYRLQDGIISNITEKPKVINKVKNESNITHLKSGNNEVRSLRIDTGLYEAIKNRASRDNINISAIVNKALEDYLNNYL